MSQNSLSGEAIQSTSSTMNTPETTSTIQSTSEYENTHLKCQSFDSCPIEIKLNILEHALVQSDPIEICPGFRRGRYLDPRSFQAWKSFSNFEEFLRLGRMLLEPPSSSLAPSTIWSRLQLESAILCVLYFQDFSILSIEIRNTFSRGKLSLPVKSEFLEMLRELIMEQKIERGTKNITTGLFTVSKSISRLALEVFYSKNNFSFKLGMVVCEAFLRTIGPFSRSMVRNLTVNQEFFPMKGFYQTSLYQHNMQNVLGWMLDDDAHRLGFTPRPDQHPYSNDRITASFQVFRDFFIGTKNSLRRLTLNVDPTDVDEWIFDYVDAQDQRITHDLCRVLTFTGDEKTFKVELFIDGIAQHNDVLAMTPFIRQIADSLGWELEYKAS